MWSMKSMKTRWSPGWFPQDSASLDVPYMDMLHQLRVRILQISRPSWERRFYMITNRESYLTPAAENFREFVMKRKGLDE